MPKDHHRKARNSQIAHRVGQYRLPGSPGSTTFNNDPLTFKDQGRPKKPGVPLKIVWQVCDDKGDVISTFAFGQQGEAERLAADRSRPGRQWFARKAKVPV